MESVAMAFARLSAEAADRGEKMPPYSPNERAARVRLDLPEIETRAAEALPNPELARQPGSGGEYLAAGGEWRPANLAQRMRAEASGLRFDEPGDEAPEYLD